MQKLFTLRNGLIVGGILALTAFVLSRKSQGQPIFQKKYLDPKVADPTLYKNFNLDIIPDGKGNYRSAQLTENELAYVIKKYGIKRIIRMNGDGSDSKHRTSYPETSRATEQRICEANGCEYYYIYAGSGYVPGKGYTTSIEKTSSVLDKGNTLIHCAHGQDRTGGMVGAYLKNRGYMTDKDQLWTYTTSRNGWMDMIRRKTFYGSGFDKYADGFYPITELKRKYP